MGAQLSHGAGKYDKVTRMWCPRGPATGLGEADLLSFASGPRPCSKDYQHSPRLVEAHSACAGGRNSSIPVFTLSPPLPRDGLEEGSGSLLSDRPCAPPHCTPPLSRAAPLLPSFTEGHYPVSYLTRYMDSTNAEGRKGQVPKCLPHPPETLGHPCPVPCRSTCCPCGRAALGSPDTSKTGSTSSSGPDPSQPP